MNQVHPICPQLHNIKSLYEQTVTHVFMLPLCRVKCNGSIGSFVLFNWKQNKGQTIELSL